MLKIDGKRFSTFNHKQADAILSWLDEIKDYKFAEDYREEIEAAMVYWQIKASFKR